MKLQQVVELSRPISRKTDKGRPTGAWRYLESRGIDPSNLPACIKCLPARHGTGAVVAFAQEQVTTDEGDEDKVHAAQLIYITPNGQKAEPSQFIPADGKRSHGKVKGHPVVLPASGDPKDVVPIVCEGIITGLSIWQAFDRNLEVWVTLGIKNLGSIPKPPVMPQVRVVADADDDGTEGHQHLVRGIHALHRRGTSVTLVRPEGSDGRDANDVLMAGGREAVRKLVCSSKLTEPKDYARMVGELVAKDSETATDPNDPRPVIEFDEKNLSEMLALSQDAMLNSHMSMYQRGGRLVYPCRLGTHSILAGVKREAGTLTILPADPYNVRVWMTDSALYDVFDERSKKKKHKAPPLDFCRTFLSNKKGWHMPVLNGISDCPIIRADGSICQTEGFDLESGILLDFAGQTYPEIRDHPTEDEARASLKKLDEVVKGFPFEGNPNGLAKCPSRSVALSQLISPHVAQVIDAVPAHLCVAPEARTGKSLIIQIGGIIATGHKPPALSYTGREEEDEKRLVGAYMAGGPLLFIDNVKKGSKISGDFLCQSITDSVTSCRRLGSTGQHAVPTNMMVSISGNNVGVEGDMAFRSIVCTLDAQMPNPGERPFKVDLHQYCREHRAELVAACLTILRYGPGDEMPPPLGGFEQWSRMVRAPLTRLGERDPVESAKDLRAENPEASQLDVLMTAWAKEPSLGVGQWVELCNVVDYEKMGGGQSSVSDALHHIFEPPKILSTATLGRYLGKLLKVVVQIGDQRLRFEHRLEPNTRRSEYALCPVPLQENLL